MISERRKNPVAACPLTAALSAVGGKWKLIIIYSLAERAYRFSEILEFLGSVSPKVLSEQLGELVADQIILREETGRPPAPVFYSLTAYGATVLPLVSTMNAWGRGHLDRFKT